ncbi:DoxX family protein [Streptacidiphilus cavernicola]|uniref:DoxX family protein n=1 Tax=Streptacidiphilus cavernicola TaxID=3342716 RepID=A0ABV6VRS3_9ACTN
MIPALTRLHAKVSGDRSALLLSGLLAGAGVLHFAVPGPFDAIVPKLLPGSPRTWTKASGAAELAVAAAVALPPTRRAGGLAAAGLFAAVYPANVQMAYDYRNASPLKRAVAYGRLPLQAPLIGWALVVRGGRGRKPARGSVGSA